jgi:hypothetical protein
MKNMRLCGTDPFTFTRYRVVLGDMRNGRFLRAPRQDQDEELMYGIVHMDGSGEDNPPVETLPNLYDELFSSGIIGGDVSVIDDNSGWGMSAHRDGRLVFEHLGGQGSPRHMIPVPKEHVLELRRRLIDGDIDGLLLEPSRPGYTDK